MTRTFAFSAGGGGVVEILDTRANILATASPDGTIAYATDENAFYVRNGSAWYKSVLNLTIQENTADDLGAIPFRNNQGYTFHSVSNKKLHNVYFGDNASPRDGAWRFNTDDNEFQGYISGEWKNIRALTELEIADIVLWSLFDGQPAGNDVEVIKNHQASMGALPAPNFVYGGNF